MKQSELQEGNIYSSGDDKYRFLEKIEYSEKDGDWYAHYKLVGSLLIRGEIHKFSWIHSKCLLRTFAKWALYGLSEDTFRATRQEAR